MRTARGVMKKQGAVTGVFQHREDAGRAYNLLLDRGYRPGDVIVLMSEETYRISFGEDDHESIHDTHKESGGDTSTMVHDRAAVGNPMVLSELELVVAGPIVTALTAAGAEGLVGGIAGALSGSGILSDRIGTYEQAIRRGAIVVGIMPKGPTDRYTIGQEFRKLQGVDISGDADDF